MSMRRRYIYFLLTYCHNSSKKEHITKYSIKSTINSTEAANLPGPSSAPSARHVLVRPQSYSYLTIISKLRSTYDERLINKTSYEGCKAFLKYDSLAEL